MKLAVLLLALSLACKREKAAVKADPDEKKLPKPTSIVITRVTPRIGSKAREVRKSEMEIKVSIGGASSTTAVVRAEDDDRTEEVLALDGRKVTKVRVTYHAREETNTMAGAPSKKSSPVAGQTYVVAAKSSGPGRLEVLDTHAKVPPPDQVTVVEKDYESLGKDDPIAEALPDTPVHVGDRVPSLARAMKEKISPSAPLDTEGEVDVRVEKATSELVVFSVKATFVMTGTPGISLRMPVTGKMTVRVADGWLTEYVLDAPLEMTPGDAGAAISGSGKLSLSGKRTYR